MHDLFRRLARMRLSPAVGCGVMLAAIGLGSLLRFTMPLDVAPFLLYMPLVFLGAMAFGWPAAVLGIVASDAMAAFFFLHDGHEGSLTAGQIVAVVQYVIVGAIVVAICTALRHTFLENDRVIAELQASQAALERANETAERAREAAEEANKAKSAFLANMSHELRTPLSAVIGYSEMLEEEVEELGDPSILADLGKIKSNAKHLLSLINDVLDLSKIEANKMELALETLDLPAFLDEVAATVQSLVSRKNNALVLEAGPALGTIETDSLKLRQCLFNLLSNAAKFTEHGRITLSAQRDGDWISLAVADTGIGMTPEQLARLFQRFMQADESTTRQFGGTGLGLALSRAFAELLGGTIDVQSEPGRGTCFTLRIPARAIAPGEPAEPNPARDTVLVIDDEASQRELMTRFLQRRGYAVQVAANGRAGLALARSARPRVILLDVMMPGMDGWSVLSALKADDETKDIPVVMVSFVVDPAIGATLGAADSLPKPVDWNRLADALAALARHAGTALVVDDDADMRHRLRTVLERAGWTVVEAGDGQQALDHLAPPPDLVVLDLTMPVMDGFTVLHRLREMPGGADVPVLVLTARDITAAERDELASADRILTKGTASMAEIASQAANLRPDHPPQSAMPAGLSRH